MGDERLVRQAQCGDSEALEELCRREWRPVYALLYATLRDRQESEDATQEVFLRALRSFDRYRHRETPFRSYLATIAKNLLRDCWRRHRPTLVDLEDQQDPPSSDPQPDERVIAADTHRSVHDLLDTLNPDQRDVIRLRVLEGRPTDEVAEILGRNSNAIRQLQYRALSTLRTRMQEGTHV
jgi:RNA polymerase sigma-70 factor, ECF subfamily